jgi:hypothetical protein
MAPQAGTYEGFLREFESWTTQDLLQVLTQAYPQVEYEARRAANTLLMRHAQRWQPE